MTELRIELLGGFRVVVEGCLVDDAAWRRKKPAAVVKMLALAPGHRLHRDQLIDRLWPELEPAAAGANLRKAVHLARRALEQVGGADLIASDAECLWLDRSDLWLDVDRFHRAVARARHEGDVAGYREAIQLYAGELLPEDLYEEWAAAPREEARLTYVAALEELVGLLASRGEVDAAIEVSRTLVAADPLSEENAVELVRLLALAGRRADALRVYGRMETTPAEELGAEPGVAAQELYEEVRSGRLSEPALVTEQWERVGDLRVLCGDPVGAAHGFENALESASAASAGRIERKVADAWLMGHQPDRAAPHLAAAEAAGPDGAERGRLTRSRANLAWETGDLTAAQRFAERAREVAAAHGTPDDVAAAYEALAIVDHFTGAWRDGLSAELERLSSADTGAEELARVFDIHHCIGQYHLYGDGLSDSVEGYAREILDRAERAEAVRAQAFAWCLLGESLLLQTRWDEAAGCLERSGELYAGLGSRSGGLAWQRRAELAACTGRFDEVEGHLGRAAAIATVSPMACHLWGRVHATGALAAVLQHDPERAVTAVRAAGRAAARYGDCPSCSALLNPVAAEAYAALGEVDAARAHAAAAERVGSMFSSSAWQAMAASAAGSVALAEGDPATARDRFDAAAALYLKAGQPYWERRARGNAEGTPTS